MKKEWKIAILVAVVAVAGSYVAFGQRPRGGMMGRGMMRGPYMQPGAGMGMCPMCGGMMMGKTVAPTSDGGALVSVGTKLVKYNASMEKVKEVEIPMDIEKMSQQMQKIWENCPMHKQMMQMMQKQMQSRQEGSN
jgi:hypothetical protein